MDNWSHIVDLYGIKKPVSTLHKNPYLIWMKDNTPIFIEDKTRTILIKEQPRIIEPIKRIVIRKVPLYKRLFRIFCKLVYYILECC